VSAEAPSSAIIVPLPRPMRSRHDDSFPIELEEVNPRP
jgi:hypothetical protein